jgi:tRNA ligase
MSSSQTSIAHLQPLKYAVILTAMCRNNHLIQHRRALRTVANAEEPPACLLALDWSGSIASIPSSQAHRICCDRILRRGDSHQALLADTSSARAHEEVVWQFLQKMEGLSESEVDHCFDMDIEWDMEGAIRNAIHGIVPVLGLEMPNEEKIMDAIAVAKQYAPAINRLNKNKKTKDVVEPRYFAFLPEVDLHEMVGNALAKATNEEGREFWEHLKNEQRVTSRPHITVVHTKALPQESELWNLCLHLRQLSPSFRFRFGSLVWNDRVMAVAINGVESDDSEASRFVANIPRDVMNRLHITVGTRGAKVAPVEAKNLIEKWRSGNADGVRSLELGDLVGKGRLSGLFL